MSPMVEPAVTTSRAPSLTLSTLVEINALISRAALALRPARPRTSLATTAKPRPCSPARAASTAAFSARIFVWNAMPSMMPTMSAIFLLLALISSMVLTTSLTTSPPLLATSVAFSARALAWRVLSALAATICASCAMLAAVCCRLLAACSVRMLRSVLPAATSELATWMDSPESRTSVTT
ncbi:hypothetical protein D3C71_1219540 [compost metagenome]